MKSWLLVLGIVLIPANAQTHQKSVMRVGRIKVEGAKAIKTEQVIKICGIKPRSYINDMTFAGLPAKIEKYYAGRGYLRTKVSVRKEINRGVVDLIVGIDEGSVYLIRRLEFIGNEASSDILVRRKIRINEGERYREERIQQTLRSFNQWGRFERLNRGDIETHIDEQKHIVDILIKLKEKR